MQRIPIKSAYAALYLAFLFPMLIAAATNFNCSEIAIEENGKTWDLSKLGGPHFVTHTHETPPTINNTTFTLDICKDLEIDDSVDKNHQCPSGTRVCGIERINDPSDDTTKISEVIPIAGNLGDHGGGDLDAKVTILTQSDSDSALKEGIRIEFNGGYYINRRQKAVIELVCDPGLEPGDNASNLTYIKYDLDIQEPDVKVLLLEWRTKDVCSSQNEDTTQRSHWGFFTWFLIIAFLVTASYLIFGSWLNYNRYGARGWDLLPHGDTIRDIPYLLKDWTRRVMNTVSGSGYRGGYSAV